jgi:hypothetical protein
VNRKELYLLLTDWSRPSYIHHKYSPRLSCLLSQVNILLQVRITVANMNQQPTDDNFCIIHNNNNIEGHSPECNIPLSYSKVRGSKFGPGTGYLGSGFRGFLQFLQINFGIVPQIVLHPSTCFPIHYSTNHYTIQTYAAWPTVSVITCSQTGNKYRNNHTTI